jgi:hypothetical protein
MKSAPNTSISAPPVYRPPTPHGSVQLMAAPPVYSPFTAQSLQRKSAPSVNAPAMPALRPAPRAAGPAPYRPAPHAGSASHVQRMSAPPVYRPAGHSQIASPGHNPIQRKVQPGSSVAAPAVFRPVIQRAAAPPVYNPQAVAVLQRKTPATSAPPAASLGPAVLQLNKTHAWSRVQVIRKKFEKKGKNYVFPSTKKELDIDWLSAFVDNFPEYKKQLVEEWNKEIKKPITLKGEKKPKGPPRVVEAHKIKTFDIPDDQTDYLKRNMDLILDALFPHGKRNQLTFNEAVKQKQTTLLEATINGQLFGKFSNTTREMHGDDKANWWHNYPQGMTKIDDCPHAEDNLITKLYEMKASLPAKDAITDRAPVLSIKINNSPCERCAKNLMRACKELKLSLRVKATYLFLADGDFTDDQKIKQSGVGLLVTAGVPVKRWTERSLLKRVASTKAGEQVKLLRRLSFDSGDTRFAGANAITSHKWPDDFSSSRGNFDNSAQLQNYTD